MSEATDWDVRVELLELAVEGSTGRAHPDMALDEAVDLVLSWPIERQNRAAIRSHDPIAVQSGRQVIERYFLNGWGIRALAHEEVRTDPNLARQLRPRRSRAPRATGIALATASSGAVATGLKAALVGLMRFFT